MRENLCIFWLAGGIGTFPRVKTAYLNFGDTGGSTAPGTKKRPDPPVRPPKNRRSGGDQNFKRAPTCRRQRDWVLSYWNVEGLSAFAVSS